MSSGPILQVAVQSLVVVTLKLRDQVYDLDVRVNALRPTGLPRCEVVRNDTRASLRPWVWSPVPRVPHYASGIWEHELWADAESEIIATLCEASGLVPALEEMLHAMPLELRD